MILSKKANNKGADLTAQAGLLLCCLQTPEDRFSRIKVHKILDSELVIYLESLCLNHSHQKITNYCTVKLV